MHVLEPSEEAVCAGLDGVFWSLAALLDGVECRIARGALPGSSELFLHFRHQLEQHLALEERTLGWSADGAGVEDAVRQAIEGGWSGPLRRVTAEVEAQLRLGRARGLPGQLSGLRELLADHHANDLMCLRPLLVRALPTREQRVAFLRALQAP